MIVIVIVIVIIVVVVVVVVVVIIIIIIIIIIKNCKGFFVCAVTLHRLTKQPSSAKETTLSKLQPLTILLFLNILL
jgi:hypothetical protein